MSGALTVVWDGSRATDPYLCVDVDAVTPSQVVPLTPERREEIVAYAHAHDIHAAARRYGMSGQSIGWLIRKAVGRVGGGAQE